MSIKTRSFTMHKDLLQTIATKQNVDLNSGIIEAVRNAYFAFKESGQGDQVTIDDVEIHGVRAVESPLFADGFEPGDTSGWTGTVP